MKLKDKRENSELKNFFSVEEQCVHVFFSLERISRKRRKMKNGSVTTIGKICHDTCTVRLCVNACECVHM